MKHSYKISGMTCGNCVAKVRSELLKIGSVLQADVQLQDPQAKIEMERHIPLETLQDAIDKAGKYRISPETGSLEKQPLAEQHVRSSYFPIVLIFGFISGITFLIQVMKSSFSWMVWMMHFMSGFFIVFSFFKFLDLKGFSNSYRQYDIVAAKFPAWGFLFPFIELGLGIAFLIGYAPLGMNIVTFIIMGIACVGVIKGLLSRRKIQCACLGTSFNLPLSTVALFEDVLMMAMSLIMIMMMI